VGSNQSERHVEENADETRNDVDETRSGKPEQRAGPLLRLKAFLGKWSQAFHARVLYLRGKRKATVVVSFKSGSAC